MVFFRMPCIMDSASLDWMKSAMIVRLSFRRPGRTDFRKSGNHGRWEMMFFAIASLFLEGKKRAGRKGTKMRVNEILIEAGKILKMRYFEKQNYTVKERFHLLGQVDIEMDQFISTRLQKYYPTYSIFSEESEAIKKDKSTRWILDPIDGTTNFIMGNPYFAIALALERDNEIVEGHVYNPVSDEYFYADRYSDCSYMNKDKLNVSNTALLAESLVAFGYSAKMQVIENYYSKWRRVFMNCRKGIGWVAPALSICNVARGRIDAFIDTGCSMHGQAAASIILEKANGRMFDNGFKEYDFKSKGAIFCSKAIEGELRNSYNNRKPKTRKRR